jgi:hypothetical protein
MPIIIGKCFHFELHPQHQPLPFLKIKITLPIASPAASPVVAEFVKRIFFKIS